MPEKIYCPYSDSVISRDEANLEHIIPLSLGGCDQFSIFVSEKCNSQAGSKIDGNLANDFLLLFRRSDHDARGHSKKKPIIKTKKAYLGEEKKPIQLELTKTGMRAYSPVLKRDLDEHELLGNSISAQFNFAYYERLKFAAKVALSGGYFIFGDWFRKKVDHHELRVLMEYENYSREQVDNLRIKGYTEFHKPSDVDAGQYHVDKFFCSNINGSCVYFVPGSDNLGVIVGILGRYLATLNIPADTEDFPFSEENDLGHAIIVESGNLKRMSYRELALRSYDHLLHKKLS